MTKEQCKIGMKIWYHPVQTDKSIRKPGKILYGPDYMYGDYACLIDCADGFINVHHLSIKK